jgi:hypothetical protein
MYPQSRGSRFLPILPNSGILKAEAVMGTAWKPVQPTEIKDITIIREVIAQIRKPIPQYVINTFNQLDLLLQDYVLFHLRELLNIQKLKY